MRVLLADDHRLVIEGISNLLKVHGIEVVGIANDGLEAVALAQQLSPGLILMDIRMPRCDGLTATRMIKAAQPEIQIVMLTTSTEDQDLFEAVKSGACGYLLKSMGGDAFIDALLGIEQGVPPFSPGLASRLLKEFARLSLTTEQEAPAGRPEPEKPAAIERLEAEGLTERQAEVLRLVAIGLTYKEVGDQLFVSERTVRFHMTQIMNKLHLYNRTQVLVYAGKLGIKPPE
ncbi:MAG: response regulator transcription factor [Gammaproteobacteria bacterium]|nr:response regulator transcription factor [Gammaproteobacteria bacterium]